MYCWKFSQAKTFHELMLPALDRQLIFMPRINCRVDSILESYLVSNYFSLVLWILGDFRALNLSRMKVLKAVFNYLPCKVNEYPTYQNLAEVVKVRTYCRGVFCAARNGLVSEKKRHGATLWMQHSLLNKGNNSFHKHKLLESPYNFADECIFFTNSNMNL